MRWRKSFRWFSLMGGAMKNDTGKDADRLMIMEEKLEYQDYTMEKLNEVIITQQRQLDKLEGEMLSLRKKFDVVYAEMDMKPQKS